MTYNPLSPKAGVGSERNRLLFFYILAESVFLPGGGLTLKIKTGSKLDTEF